GPAGSRAAPQMSARMRPSSGVRWSGRTAHGNGPDDSVSSQHSPPQSVEPADPPLAVAPPSGQESPSSGAGEENTGGISSESPSDPKPRRRWWRRSFTRG